MVVLGLLPHLYLLLARGDEFRNLWDRHEVGVHPDDTKRFVHPEVGPLGLTCLSLLDPHYGRLLVYTAVPRSETKLQPLGVVGAGHDGLLPHLRPRGVALARRSCWCLLAAGGVTGQSVDGLPGDRSGCLVTGRVAW